MATSVTPYIIDALVTQAQAALPTVRVYDGFQSDTNLGPDVLVVGVQDGQRSSAASVSGTSDQEQATAGTPRSRNQSGVLNCWALSWSGNLTAKTSRDSVYATLAAVENILRTSPTLGIAPPNGQVLVIQIGSEQLEQYTDGAILSFTIQFQARI